MVTLHLIDVDIVLATFKQPYKEIIIDVANAVVDNVAKEVQYMNLDWTITKYKYAEFRAADTQYYFYGVVKQ